MGAPQEYLGEILVRHGVVPAERLPALFEAMRDRGQPLAEVLVTTQAADERALAEALAAECGLGVMPKIDIDAVPLPVATRVPITYSKQHKILALSEDDEAVYCVVADPLDTLAIDDVRAVFGKPVELSVAPAAVVVDAINRVWERREDGGAKLDGPGTREEEGLQDLIDSDDDAPIIAWVNSLFQQAVRERASDIHIEPEERDVVVRYRIDGELYVVRRASKQFMAPITARIKIMAALNIAEKRLPQDGRITLKIAGKSVDIRVSTIPTSRGSERIVMRILHKASVLLQLDDLGFAPRERGIMEQLVERPDGIILVTGPTGSGKTTTLYAALNELNTPDTKLLTAEDPVEYDIEGLIQCQVNHEQELTFAKLLRSFLRQDPDIILVGEVRDLETAQIAIQASLTGHLVFTTLHTNDAPSSIARLMDLGVESFLLTATLEAIVAQRLARRICTQCKEEFMPSEEQLMELGLRAADTGGRSFYRGKGCERCNKSGYKGRLAIFEIMAMNDDMRELIMQQASTAVLRHEARKRGMRTLRECGLLSIYDGQTTIDEVVRETLGEE